MQTRQISRKDFAQPHRVRTPLCAADEHEVCELIHVFGVYISKPKENQIPPLSRHCWRKSRVYSSAVADPQSNMRPSGSELRAARVDYMRSSFSNLHVRLKELDFLDNLVPVIENNTVACKKYRPTAAGEGIQWCPQRLKRSEY